MPGVLTFQAVLPAITMHPVLGISSLISHSTPLLGFSLSPRVIAPACSRLLCGKPRLNLRTFWRSHLISNGAGFEHEIVSRRSLMLRRLAGGRKAAGPPLPVPLSILTLGVSNSAALTLLNPPCLVASLSRSIRPARTFSTLSVLVNEPEQYNMSQSVAGRINSIINIHNPSIEIHTVDRSLNTGAAVILVAGGGHNTLNVGSEAADFVPFFYNYGVNTIILRNRLRHDGYNPQTDAVNDALQSIRLIRAHAKELHLDPAKIGMMGFSAGAELTAAAAVLYEDFDKTNTEASDPLANISSRPDFAGIIYPGPSPFAKNRTPPPIPRNVPPAFIICGGSGDKVHAIWAMEYFNAMLNLGVPNIELHIYGNGRHPGDGLPDGTAMTGGSIRFSNDVCS